MIYLPTEPFIAAEAAALPRWEAAIPWQYLDIKGNVTAGLGFLLATPAAACALPFQCGDRPATEDEIVADFQRVKAMPFGQKYAAGYYQSDTSPRLGSQDMQEIAATKLVGMAQSLQRAIPEFDGLKDSAKTALSDMAWNLGVAGVLKYHNMLAALAKTPPDYATAAAECIREAGNPAFADRNSWTQSLLIA